MATEKYNWDLMIDKTIKELLVGKQRRDNKINEFFEFARQNK
jgi:hypothetical protein